MAAITDEAALIQVLGAGSFRLAPTFKHSVQSAIRTGAPLIIIDMKECTTVDSTFMGAIAGLGQYCLRIGHVQLILINLSTRVFSLLRGLGVTRLVKAYAMDALPDTLRDLSGLEKTLQLIDERPSTERETTSFMLDAHETLSKVSPENLQRFKDVVNFLREDIRRMDGGDTPT